MRIILFVVFGIVINSNAQNITIKGKAHASHIGKEIVLSDYSDYITFTKTKESSDTIDKEGYFELKIQSLITKPLLINIDNLVGKLYIQPNFVYGIYFPAKDSLTNNQEGTETIVDISVYGKDSTELNALIVDFNTQYNNLFLKRFGFLKSCSYIHGVIGNKGYEHRRNLSSRTRISTLQRYYVVY